MRKKTISSIKNLVRKVIPIFVMILSLTVVSPGTQVAAEVGKGSLTITVKYAGNPIEGMNISVHKVGDIREITGGFAYDLTAELSGAGISFADVLYGSDPDAALDINIAAAKILNDYIIANGIARVSKVSGVQGEVSFPNLDAGMYLVAQLDTATASYIFAPYLINVPTGNATGNGWKYDITMKPKTEIKPVPTPTPTPTATPVVTATATPTATPVITATPAPTATPVPTNTPTPTPKTTPTPTPPPGYHYDTPTPKPTQTPKPGNTPTPNPTGAPTATPSITSTPQPTPVNTPNTTEPPANTPNPEPTPTPKLPPVDPKYLQPQPDGTYIQIDDDGVPKGRWELGPDGEWVYVEFPEPPLGDITPEETLPQTGVNRMIVWKLLIGGSSMIIIGLFLLKKKRNKDINQFF